MRKKYELTNMKRGFIVNGETKALYQIRALRDIPAIGIEAGDLGGHLHDESCLSQEGDCWVFEYSGVAKGGRVEGDARVRGDSLIGAEAVVSDYAVVTNSHILTGSTVKGNANVVDSDVNRESKISGSANVRKSGLMNIGINSGVIAESTVQCMNLSFLEFQDYTHIQDSILDIYDSQAISKRSVRLKGVVASTVTKFRVLEHIVVSNARFDGDTAFEFGVSRSEADDTSYIVCSQGGIYGKDLELITVKSTVKGQIELAGKVELYHSEVHGCASVTNSTDRWLTLNRSVLSECASIQKDSPMTGSIFKDETLDGDIRVTC